MFKKLCLILTILSWGSITYASETEFKINFTNQSQNSVKAGQNIKVNWWIKNAPASGRVQLFLEGVSDRGVMIVSSGYYQGTNILPDQVGKTISGSEEFSTDQLPAGTYNLVAYICDYHIFACSADRYSLNRHKSNSLEIQIKNNSSHFLSFDNEVLKRESFDFDETVNFSWFNENYRSGLLTFKLEAGDGTIYDIVMDSTEKNEARNDISSPQELRHKHFTNKSFSWIGVTKGLEKKYKLNEDSPYFGKTISLEPGLYRILMYVHRNAGFTQPVENYVVKSIPFTLRSKIPTKPSKEETQTQQTTPKRVEEKEPDPLPLEESEPGKEVTTPKITPEENKVKQRLNRRQLLELYKRQASSQNTVSQKNSNLTLLQRLKRKKSQNQKSQNTIKAKQISNSRNSRINFRQRIYER